jgi:hypothetical protein
MLEAGLAALARLAADLVEEVALTRSKELG